MDLINFIKNSAQLTIELERLQYLILNKKKIKIKFGIDPTGPDLTLGHFVIINVLKKFQICGHEIILIIGDYTAEIGDPSGKSKERKLIPKENILYNANNYLSQIFKFLDRKKTTIYYNSEWLKSLKFQDILQLTKKITISQLLEREDLNKRYNLNQQISLGEMIYPIIQGYDSVAINADVEIGGIDQLFNLHMGRLIQKIFNQHKQSIICMPLLIGLDGNKKMSKSYNNYISVNEEPQNLYGKLMSINDKLMIHYYKTLLGYNDNKILSEKKHPMILKEELSFKIVKIFYGEKVAKKALENFKNIFSKKNYFNNCELITLNEQNIDMFLIDILYNTKKFESKKFLKRLIKANGIKIYINKKFYIINDYFYKITLNNIQKYKNNIFIKVGKKIFFQLYYNNLADDCSSKSHKTFDEKFLTI